MDYLQAIVLGIVQGITEFLPISSSGHLILIPKIFGWQTQDLAFDVSLHLGSAVAILIYFFDEYFSMLVSLVKDLSRGRVLYKSLSDKSKLLVTILVSLIPVMIIAFLVSGIIENVFRSPILVAIEMLVISFVMYIADKQEKFAKLHNIYDIPFVKKNVISISQVIALIPGTSRSGMTISTAMLLKVDRESAAKFSFLLSTPIIVAATLEQFLFGKALTEFNNYMVVGVIVSFISSFLAIKFLLQYLKNHNLTVFIIYRIVLALVLIVIMSNVI